MGLGVSSWYFNRGNMPVVGKLEVSFPFDAWIRRACWRPWPRTTLQRQPIIGTMTSGTRRAGHVAGQVERQRASRWPTTSSQVEGPEHCKVCVCVCT